MVSAPLQRGGCVRRDEGQEVDAGDISSSCDGAALHVSEVRGDGDDNVLDVFLEVSFSHTDDIAHDAGHKLFWGERLAAVCRVDDFEPAVGGSVQSVGEVVLAVLGHVVGVVKLAQQLAQMRVVEVAFAGRNQTEKAFAVGEGHGVGELAG